MLSQDILNSASSQAVARREINTIALDEGGKGKDVEGCMPMQTFRKPQKPSL